MQLDAPTARLNSCICVMHDRLCGEWRRTHDTTTTIEQQLIFIGVRGLTQHHFMQMSPPLNFLVTALLSSWR